MKYSKKIVDRICELVSTDDYTVQEIADQVGINPCTYYDWLKKKAFAKAISEAETRRFDLFKREARRGLLTLLRGKEYEEVTTEYVEGKPDANGKATPKIKSQKKVKKFILPNPTSVLFTLKNLDSDNFKDIVKSEITGKDGKPLIPDDPLKVTDSKLTITLIDASAETVDPAT